MKASLWASSGLVLQNGAVEQEHNRGNSWEYKVLHLGSSSTFLILNTLQVLPNKAVPCPLEQAPTRESCSNFPCPVKSPFQRAAPIL